MHVINQRENALSLATQHTQVDLREAVLNAIHQGSWSQMEILTDLAELHFERADVLATLWEMVDDGVLVYHAEDVFPTYRPACCG